MKDFTIHTEETAPEGAKDSLAQAKKRYGTVPNLMAIMAGAPSLLRTYAAVGDEFARTSLTAVEQQVVILTVSARNQCEYCVAAHSLLAKMAGLPEAELDALRNGEPLADAKLEALRAFADVMVEKRGWVSEQDTAAFLAAGFEQTQILEVILGIAYKTMSNYTNHIARTPLDKAFERFAWHPAQSTQVVNQS